MREKVDSLVQQETVAKPCSSAILGLWQASLVDHSSLLSTEQTSQSSAQCWGRSLPLPKLVPWMKPVCHRGLSRGKSVYLVEDEAGVQIKRGLKCRNGELEYSPGIRGLPEDVGGWM